ncbi:hypothetical protein H4R24_001472 [Coemansia sp. RSA 988]|nr:hypothetical protein H4R24_001472 [Coemansia sp. RSA 988]
MAYRKRSLDLPLPPGQTQPGSKHARSNGTLPPIRSLAEIAGHASGNEQQRALPSIVVPQHSVPCSSSSSLQLGGQQKPRRLSPDLPTTRSGDPSLSLAAIRMSSPGNPGDVQASCSSQQQQPFSAPSVPLDAVKVARNWSRDETLSLVRAIGRHYESLKRCKTNQERSNVWHRIHKEHSSQFPGRSKKASQDRWGKVLSDYKDVIVNNKEKGAARWTFDFFKEVAAIVEGDAQFMEAAVATSPPLYSPRPLSGPAMQMSRADNGSAAGDDLSLYSFENAPATSVAHRTLPSNAGTPTSGSNPPPPPPVQHHRLSEPNMTHHMHHNRNHHPSHSPMRPQSSFNPSQQVHQQNYHSQQQHQALPSYVHAQKMSPIELYPATASPHNHVTDNSRHGDSRFSPSRRTSYPQMHAHVVASTAVGHAISVHSRTPNASDTRRQQPPTHVSNYQRHSIQTLSPSQQVNSTQYPGRLSVGSIPAQTMTVGMSTPGGQDSPLVRVSPGNTTDVEPENTCRYVLDMLEAQVRRIDAQQDTLNQLRISTREAMAKVEQALQRHTRPH